MLRLENERKGTPGRPGDTRASDHEEVLLKGGMR